MIYPIIYAFEVKALIIIELGSCLGIYTDTHIELYTPSIHLITLL